MLSTMEIISFRANEAEIQYSAAAAGLQDGLFFVSLCTDVSNLSNQTVPSIAYSEHNIQRQSKLNMRRTPSSSSRTLLSVPSCSFLSHLTTQLSPPTSPSHLPPTCTALPIPSSPIPIIAALTIHLPPSQYQFRDSRSRISVPLKEATKKKSSFHLPFHFQFPPSLVSFSIYYLKPRIQKSRAKLESYRPASPHNPADGKGREGAREDVIHLIN